MFLVRKLGRKLLLSLGLLFQAISYIVLLFGLVLSVGELVVIGIYLFLVAFVNSLGGMLFLYQVEIMPINLVPLLGSLAWAISILIGLFTLDLYEVLGIFPIFLIFCVVGFLSWLYFEGYGIETKFKIKSKILSDFHSRTFLG
jgi:hypothetical protein